MKAILSLFLAVVIHAGLASAGEVHLAVAANFAPTAAALVRSFERSQGDKVVVSSGSTGRLYAQIVHGAPYDIFLAADADRPERLEADGLASRGSRFTYAFGELVLWSPNSELVDAKGAVLKSAAFRHLAVANPKTAPYGIAAREALKKLGLWNELQPRMVFGEDVGQTFQFVHTGNAELGFIARAQMIRLASRDRGSYWLVPKALYSPIEQQAVLLTRGANNHAARRFVEFLKSEPARRIIAADGYGVS